MNDPFRLSMMTYVFAKYSLPYALKSIHEIGFTQVELWGGASHAAVEHLNPVSIQKLRDCLRENRLTVSMYCPEQIMYPVAISSLDKSIRQYSIDYFKRAVIIASEIGTSRLLISSGTNLQDDDLEKAFRNSIESIKTIIRYAAEHGVTVVIEPLSHFESDLIVSYKSLHDAWLELNEFPVEVMVDLVPMFLNQESLDTYFNTFGSHLSVIHFVDCDGESVLHLIPGEGKIDFISIINTLRKYCFSGTISLEIGAKYHTNPAEATKKSFRQVQLFLQNQEIKGNNL